MFSSKITAVSALVVVSTGSRLSESFCVIHLNVSGRMLAASLPKSTVSCISACKDKNISVSVLIYIFSCT